MTDIMRMILSTLLVLQISTVTQQKQLISDVLYVQNPEIPMPMMAKSNLTRFAAMFGQKIEEHQVITEDGYILTIFHLPSPTRGPPVLLQHGLSDSADTYILRGNTSMPISLSRAGYDVWIGSERGSRYARKHVRLNPDTSKEFWDYSFHDLGYYDFPAMIDYILEKTKYKKLSIVGHSQGNTAAYVLTSTRPEYNDKIDLIIALAPVAFVDHIKEPVKYLMEMAPLLNRFLIATGQEEVLADHSVIKVAYRAACMSKSINYQMCVKGVFMAFSGENPAEFEPEFTTIVAGHYPDVLSRKSALHYYQCWMSKRFQYYDYGKEKNMKLYNSAVPPDYDFSKVTAKVAMFYGTNDNFSSLEDVERLKNKLPNVVRYTKMPKRCNHSDFIWGRYTHKYLNKRIIDVLNKYLK